MHSRRAFTGLFALGGGLIATAAGAARAAATDKAKVVYHLADADKVGFVLGNIAHHFEGMGGPDKVAIVLVVHGPPLKAFRAASANPEVAQRTAELVKSGLELDACIHTLKGLNLALKDLLPGFAVAERGGVVRIAELQAQGYAYLRP